MAINASLVGSGHSTGSSVTTAAGSCSTGDTLVAIVGFDPGTTISSISDTAGNTYSLKASVQGLGKLSAYVKENATGHASNVLTVNFSGTAFPSAHLVKVTGAAAASYDSGSLASGLDADNVSPYTITSGTLAQAASCVIACCEANNASGVSAYVSSNFTVIGSEDDTSTYWTCGVAKLVVSSTSAVTPSFTRSSESSSSASRGLIVFALKEATGGTTITPSAGSIALTGAAPTLTLASNRSPSVGSIALTGQTPTVTSGSRTITPAVGSLGIVGQTPVVGFARVIVPVVAALSLIGQTPTVSTSRTIAPSAGALALSGLAPAVTNTAIPRLGAHGLDYDFINDGGSNATTPSMVTTPPSIMLACVGRGILSDFSSSTVSDNKGNGNYPAVTTSHAYTGFPSSGTRLYAGNIVTGGSGTTVSASKPTTSDEVTVLAVECLGVDRIVDQSWVEDLSSPNTATSVTTTGPAILVAFWWGDDSNGELGPLGVSTGWTLLDYTSSLASNHVQGASAYRIVGGSGTYSIDWTPTTSQGAQLYLVALQAGVQIAPSTGAVTATGIAPTLIAGTVRVPTVASAALTGVAPQVVQGAVRVPVAGSAALSGVAPSRLQGTVRAPTTAALALTGVAPSIALADYRAPSVGSISITGIAPTVVITAPGNVTPLVGSLGIGAAAPVVTQAASRIALAGQGTFTGAAPLVLQAIYRTPSAGALAITGAAASIAQLVAPQSGSLALIGAAPLLVVPGSRVPLTGSISLNGSAPTVLASQSAAPAAGSLVLSGSVPLVVVASVRIPGAGSLGLSGATPSLLQSVGLQPVVGSMSFTGLLPVVEGGVSSLRAPPNRTVPIPGTRRTIRIV